MIFGSIDWFTEKYQCQATNILTISLYIYLSTIHHIQLFKLENVLSKSDLYYIAQYVATWHWEIEILFQRLLSYKSYMTGMAFQSPSKICVRRRNSLTWLAVKAETIFWAFWKSQADSQSNERISSSDTNFWWALKGHPSHITFVRK